MSRSLPEWIGKTDDTSIPARVRLRIFMLADGHCANCQRRLRPGDKWQADHRIAIINGGQNRETNLQVLCEWCHKPKTVFDLREKSATYKRRKRHYGIKQKRGRFCGWRKFDGTPVYAARET